MKAEERSVSSVLSEEVTYVIPSFQRPYSWGKDNVNQLLDDLWEAYEGKDKEYFLGSLITIEREPKERYDVIDGQQRLTTLNLVFARLRDHIPDGAAKAEIGKRIRPFNVLTNEAETPRLIVRKADQAFFAKHVLDAAPLPTAGRDLLSAPQRRFTENLEEIDTFLKARSEQQLKAFANYLLKSVFVVFVQTASMDSAYRLFNVLNARGMSLSNADLIKNSLFQQTDADAQTADRLEESWTALEEEIGIDRLDAFFGHHRTAVVGAKASKKLHEEVESIIERTEGGPFVFLDHVQKSADNYARILSSDFADPYTNRSMRALRRIGYDEWIPPLLAYLNDPLEDLPEREFVGLLEKITMQNWVRRLGRTARLTVYYQLIGAIHDRLPSDDIRLIFVNAARNDEFMHLLGSEVYGAPFAHAVLLRLEESAQDISVTKSFHGSLTIEHVLPKAMKEEYWTSRFQPDQHVRWLNRLGNLAMLSGSKNSRAQYYDFDRKKGIYNHANQQVSFDLTKEVCAEPDWNMAAIEKRHQRLLDLAGATWSI